MLVTDTDWNIEYINQSFEDLTKYSEEELIGEKITIIEPDESNISQYDKFDLNMGWDGEIIHRKKHGELYHVEQTITPIKNKNDDIEKYMIIQKDITQEKLNNQVLDVLNRVLRHNLRSSINVIEGYTDMLSVDADSEQQKNAIETIQNEISLDEFENHRKNIREKRAIISNVKPISKSKVKLKYSLIYGDIDCEEILSISKAEKLLEKVGFKRNSSINKLESEVIDVEYKNDTWAITIEKSNYREINYKKKYKESKIFTLCTVIINTIFVGSIGWMFYNELISIGLLLSSVLMSLTLQSMAGINHQNITEIGIDNDIINYNSIAPVSKNAYDASKLSLQKRIIDALSFHTISYFKY
jgi:PAS domain S-box-containing protein